MNTFYLPRRLISNERTYTEAELLAASNYVVVLAEPGGGKTELMGSLANQLGVNVVTANKFSFSGNKEKNIPLVIDAFDELAKVGTATGINKLLSQADAAEPTHVYLSSRSSEWDAASTFSFQDFLGHAPLIVRLCEFDEFEQRAIFNQYVPGEDFVAFKSEVARFDLEMLLHNPQFLKLFADAYIESKRYFIDKRSIFALAVERLAKEANPSIRSGESPLSVPKKIDISSEVFAKLLLAGAEGVSVSEATEDRMYPSLLSLSENNSQAREILATRLFKPGDTENQHRQIHKIIAEYCAAAYLTRRFFDPADSLTFQKCIPVIAPNSTMRDELRGLLGWIASLGNKVVQERAIEIDAYSVLANGAPSLLEHSSKRLLLRKLKEIESKDPYFRRGDFGRRFSIAGFFTQEVVNDIKPLLVPGSDGHLRDLLLELLAGASVLGLLTVELRNLVLAPEEAANARYVANSYLLAYFNECDQLIRRRDQEVR